MGGKTSLIDGALRLAGEATGAFGDDAARVVARDTGEAASGLPAHLQQGFKVEAHPTASADTKALTDYLNTRDHLSMDQQSRMERKADMGLNIDAYHGSPRDIHGFQSHLNNPQGYWGAHHYSTSSPLDASVNYATPNGSDLLNRLSDIQDQVMNEYHPSDITKWYEEKYGDATGINPQSSALIKEWSEDAARERLGITNHGAVYPVSVRMKNPAVIDNPNQTFWPIESQFDENGDIIGESGPGADLIQHTRDVLSEYDVHPSVIEQVSSDLWNHILDYDGVDAKTYNDTMRKVVDYIIDPETGSPISTGHAMSDVFQRMGHDGIEMGTEVFAPSRFRRGMEGTGGDTRHYITFDPKNIRSRFGAFDPFKADSTRLSDASGGRVERDGYAGGSKVIKKALELAGDAVGAARRTPTEVFPDLAERYPAVKEPVWAIDKKKGTGFWAKDLTPEALAVQKARKAIQKDIDAGGYTPFFDPAKRADVDPSLYPSTGTTVTDALPKKPETQAKWRAKAFDPEGLQRLREGYEEGLKQKGAAENWYFMKQLEDEFVKELGPEEGRRQFKERFAKSMALTTGGADPTDNLMMAYYGNFMRNKGEAVPDTNQMPFPIGGRYVGGNMDMFERNAEKELSSDSPKRMNFQNNFLGHKTATIDEQMSKGFDPKMQMPEWYGPYEEAINYLAGEYGVDPRYFQEVGWAGLKAKSPGGYKGKPMIGHVNEAIERTSRITGVPPEEVVRRGLVRAEMPIYSVAGPLAGAAAIGALDEGEADDDIDGALRIAKGGGGELSRLVTKLLGPAEREGLAPLTRPSAGYSSVPGKPGTAKLPFIGEIEAKPIPQIMDAADSYMTKLGKPGAHHMEAFPELDIEKARRIAEAYDRMKHAPSDPAVKRAYDAMAQETLDQLEAVKGAGIDFSAIRGDDPYKASPAIGYADIAERGHLSFFPTDAGFGSSIDFDPSQNPLLKRIGKVGDLDNATVNDAFRIVHDLYGHYGPGNPFFRAPGEERAFKLHSKMYSPEALPAMASETRGQNSWLNYGPHGDANRKAASENTIFADQKTGIMPPWTYKAGGGAVDDALRIAKAGGGAMAVVTDANGTQYDVNGNVIHPDTPAQQPTSATAQPQGTGTAQSSGVPLRTPYTDSPDFQWRDQMAKEMPDNELVRWVTTSLTEPAAREVFDELDKRVGAQRFMNERGYTPLDDPTNYKPGRDVNEDVRNFMKAYEHSRPAGSEQGEITNMPGTLAEDVRGLLPYGVAQTVYDKAVRPAGEWVNFATGIGDYADANYQFAKTGKTPSWEERAMMVANLAPGMALAAARPIWNTAKKVAKAVDPRVVGAAAGTLGLTTGSDDAQAGPERWFSKALEVAQALPMEKMTGEQALAMLRKGASAEELRWTGVDKLLQSSPTVEKQALVDYLAKNRVKINKIELGGGAKPTKREDVALDDEIKAKYRDENNSLQAELGRLGNILNAGRKNGMGESEFRAAERQYVNTRERATALTTKMLDEQIAKMGGLGRGTKYHDYSTPGGEGYRETLYQMGGSGMPKVVQKDDKMWHVVGEDGKTWQSYLSQNDADRAAASLYRTSGRYTSPHWSDPDVLMHSRSQTLGVEVPGANRPYKAHNVDETQSDLAQAGRKEGFMNPEGEARRVEIDAERKRLSNEALEKKAKIQKQHFADMAPYIAEREANDERIMDSFRRGKISAGDMHRLADQFETEMANRTAHIKDKFAKDNEDVLSPIAARLKSLNEEYDSIKVGKMPNMPYVGSTDQWTDFAIKNELDKALDSGSDYFTWSPGDVHADRYSLDKQISGLRYDPETKELEYRPKNVGSDEWQTFGGGIPEEKLEDYVGKEVAEKLLAQKPKMYGVRELHGIDLKVGGEGMRGYYDNVYLKRVQKVLEKATGKKPKIEEITVQTANGPRKQLGIRLDEDMQNARFSDFNRGGRATGLTLAKKRATGGGLATGGGVVERALALTAED
jgi:hypothetical protein